MCTLSIPPHRNMQIHTHANTHTQVSPREMWSCLLSFTIQFTKDFYIHGLINLWGVYILFLLYKYNNPEKHWVKIKYFHKFIKFMKYLNHIFKLDHLILFLLKIFNLSNHHSKWQLSWFCYLQFRYIYLVDLRQICENQRWLNFSFHYIPPLNY